jgi:transglutaminase-like putative cysteine protease
MRNVTIASTRDPLIIETALECTRTLGGFSPLRRTQQLRDFLLGVYRFMPDPAMDGDFLRTPRLLIDGYRRTGEICGDCDDVAMLAAALAKVAGLAARFVAVAFHSPHSPFSHVFTEIATPDGWIDLDMEPEQRRALFPFTRRMELMV